MNIAFVNPEYPSLSGTGHGGIATYIYNMANACASQGHTVHILARASTQPDPLHAGVHFHYFSHTPLRGPLSLFNRYRRSDVYWERCCSQAVKELLFDIHRSHSLDIVEFAEYGGLAHELTGRLPFRTVIHFHTPTQLIDELNNTPCTRHRAPFYRLEQIACHRVHAFKSPSRALRDYIVENMDIAAEKIAIIPTLMPTDEFDCIEKTQPHANRINLLFAGRLERRKGAELLIEAANDILNLDPRIHLTIVGETTLNTADSYREAVERAVENKNRSRLWLLGPVERTQITMLYRRSSIFLMLSLFENAPNALLEAMAARLPIITTDGGGNAECITHRHNGLMIAPHDHRQLVHSIHELIKHPHRAQVLADQAYKDVKARFDPSRIARETLTFFRKVLQAA